MVILKATSVSLITAAAILAAFRLPTMMFRAPIPIRKPVMYLPLNAKSGYHPFPPHYPMIPYGPQSYTTEATTTSKSYSHDFQYPFYPMPHYYYYTTTSKPHYSKYYHYPYYYTTYSYDDDYYYTTTSKPKHHHYHKHHYHHNQYKTTTEKYYPSYDYYSATTTEKYYPSYDFYHKTSTASYDNNQYYYSDSNYNPKYAMHPMPRNYNFYKTKATTTTTESYPTMPYQFYYPFYPTSSTTTTPSTSTSTPEAYKGDQPFNHKIEKVNYHYHLYYVKPMLEFLTTKTPISSSTESYRKKSKTTTMKMIASPAPLENYRPNRAQVLYSNNDYDNEPQLMFDDTKNYYYYVTKNNTLPK